MEKIKDIKAEEIKDSRGKPTLRVTVFTENFNGKFDVPSGASTGEREALELRDGDGGMHSAIEIIQSQIKDVLLDAPIENQKEIDKILLDLDGTEGKTNLGGNSMIGISVACARVAAQVQGLELYEYLQKLSAIEFPAQTPKLFINLINGGKHTAGGSPFQEHQIIAEDVSPKKAIEISKKIQTEVIEKLKGKKYSLGDEGGFVFAVRDVYEPFEILQGAIKDLNLEERISLGTDIAASTFYKDGS